MSQGERYNTVRCTHYRRQCNIVAPCCGRVTCCHRGVHCSQKLERDHVASIVCIPCGRLQPVARRCRYCRTPFGKHYCRACLMWTNDDAFHCDKCGYCVQGRRDQTRHCSRCGKCYPLTSREHTCAPIANMQCAVNCGETMRASRQRLFTPPCGHAMHEKCFYQRILVNFACPRRDCRKPIADVSQWRTAVNHTSTRSSSCTVNLHCNSCGTTKKTKNNRSGLCCPSCASSNVSIIPPTSPVSGESSSSRTRRR